MSRIRANQITNQSADGAPTVQNGLVISGVTTSTTFSGSGASLTNLPAGNLTGTVADARISTLTASKLTGALPALDGSNLTGISAGTSLSGSTNNTVCTVTGANAIQGEANLTFDGSKLGVNISSPHYTLDVNGDNGGAFTASTNSTAGQLTVVGKNSGGSVSAMSRIKSYPSGNGNTSQMAFETRNSSSSMVEALRIDSSGRVMIGTTTEGNGNADEFTISYINHSGVSGGDQGRCGMTIRSGENTSNVMQNGYIYFSDGTSGANESMGVVAYEHSTDSMYFSTAQVARLRINSSGQVTQPAQPSFAVGRNSNAYQLNNTTMPFDTTRHNTGSHFNTSNYRFTAPVAGRYLFTFHSIIDGSINSGQQHYSIRINNSVSRGMNSHMTPATSNWDQVSSSYILELSENDYVTMYSNSDTRWHGNDWQLFCGQLLS